MAPRFRPVVDESICIAGKGYLFDAHPAITVRRQLYIQEGRRARIYRLIEADTGRYHALKEFRLSYHDKAQAAVAAFLEPFAAIAGMTAALRRVITAESDPELFNRFHELQYAVLMPWIGDGTLRTWAEVIAQLQAGGRALPRPDAHRLAARLLAVMSELERRGAAHTDISPGNVVCDPQKGVVELIDLEELFAPDAPEPAQKNTGSAGYRHRAMPSEGIWAAEADRFSAAVLAAEMLAASDAGLVAKVHEDHFFNDPDKGTADNPEGSPEKSDLHDPTAPTYQAVMSHLQAHWPAFAALFEKAWLSPTLADAPTFAALADALGPAPVEKTFRPAIGLAVLIDGRTYRFAAHPAARVVYCEKGERADVYQLIEEETGNLFALKCDRSGTHDDRLTALAWYLGRQAHLPGLKNATRTVVNEKTASDLFRAARKLRYAVLMPWIAGGMRPWPEILSDLKTAQATLPQASVRTLAERFLSLIAGLEAQGLAHTNLIDNVMCNPQTGEVELIGLELFFGPGWPAPYGRGSTATGGDWSAGTPKGPWNAGADRLPAVLLAAEMLAACDPQLVSMADGRTFFPQTELGVTTSSRYQALLAHLRQQWPPFAQNFDRIWNGTTAGSAPESGDSHRPPPPPPPPRAPVAPDPDPTPRASALPGTRPTAPHPRPPRPPPPVVSPRPPGQPPVLPRMLAILGGGVAFAFASWMAVSPGTPAPLPPNTAAMAVSGSNDAAVSTADAEEPPVETPPATITQEQARREAEMCLLEQCHTYRDLTAELYRCHRDPRDFNAALSEIRARLALPQGTIDDIGSLVAGFDSTCIVNVHSITGLSPVQYKRLYCSALNRAYRQHLNRYCRGASDAGGPQAPAGSS
jgi:hypothetical protein